LDFTQTNYLNLQVITMEMDLKLAKAEIQRLQTEREKLEQVSIILFCDSSILGNKMAL
jgi:hypothetical protein